MMNRIISFFYPFIVFFVFSCSGTTGELTYETIPVKKKDIETSVLATGIIKPKIGAEVRVGSRISGIVKRLYVKNGDSVNKGDLLAELDDSELSARYRLEYANLENARTLLKYSKIEMERAKTLVEKDFSSIQAYDNLVKEYELALSRVSSQQAAVDYAETELGYTKIFAPISGVIGDVSTQEGETVSAAFTAPTFVTIIDLNRIEIWAYVDETDIGKVKNTQSATFTVDTYPGTTFQGTVVTIYPKAEIRDNVVNYVAIIEMNNTDDKILRPEMTASVTIRTESAGQVLCIPNHVIKRQKGETVVYVLEDKKPVLRKIKTGIRGNLLTEVVEGLGENDLVILNVEDLNHK